MLRVVLALVIGGADCRRLVESTGHRSFGDSMKEGIVQPAQNITLFNHSGEGSLTYLWWTMSSLKYTQVDGWEDTWCAIYVDGETTPSVEFQLYMAAGVGFHDQTGPWGNARVGKMGRDKAQQV